MTLRLIGTLAIILALVACGGGGSDPPTTEQPPVDEGTLPPPDAPQPVVYPPLPLQTPALGSQAPTVDLGGTLHVGADVAPPQASLASEPAVCGVTISSGRVNDGISREDMLAYLRYDAAEYAPDDGGDGFVARFADRPPVVQVAEGTPPELVHIAVHAVQLINASLPHDWQIEFSSIPGTPDSTEEMEGRIVVQFAPSAEWTADLAGCETAAGCAAWRWAETQPPRIVGGTLWIDPAVLPGIHLQSATVHEMMHFLGRLHGDSERFRSVMADSQLPGHFLFPLDREALFAIYAWLPEDITRPEDLASHFGPWSETSFHVRGDIEDVDGAAFGVRYSFNGLSQPWAFGPTPHTNLAANGALSGSVNWAGVLLGYGLDSVVAGEADLSIELSSLRGNLEFSNLRELTDLASQTAEAWGDGDLNYRVRVRGNSFVQTGGDVGIVTGIFVGAGHEGMVGTLQRDDLAAAFGGSR